MRLPSLKAFTGVVDLLNTHKGELQDMGIDDGDGVSIVKYSISV
jgi:hypothetical protein